MVKINQKYYEKDGKIIGYVAVQLFVECGDRKYIYPVKFDEKTRKRFNNYARSLGYTIGVTNNVCSDCTADCSPSVFTDDDLPF